MAMYVYVGWCRRMQSIVRLHGRGLGIGEYHAGGYALQYWRADAIEYVVKTVRRSMSLLFCLLQTLLFPFSCFRYAFPISKGSPGKE